MPITDIRAQRAASRSAPFDLELITLTHSIPEPNALAIRTPAGTVLHTGDWKLDPEPLLGAATDEAGLRQLGDEGVLALDLRFDQRAARRRLRLGRRCCARR